MSDTIVIENTTPTTVITAATISDKYLATRIRTARDDPKREAQVLVVDGPINLETEKEKETGDQHENGWYKPEGGAKCFPPPAR